MAASHVCFVVLSLVIVEAAVLSGRALYCRDPDTGKLHAVNSTWASSTFCGNYTCKLRKINVTETEYTPIRQLNITNVSNDTSKDNITVTIEERTEPEIESIIHKDRTIKDSSENKIIKDKNDLQRKTTDAEKVKETSNKNQDGNRYLTENEIKSISEVLHTVKKSDLDAIVDIYNLAQDIYSEMDKATNEGTVDDTVNDIVDEKYLKHNKKSYWYDPMAIKERLDMDYQGSNHAASTAQPKRNVPTYFNGALTTQDFGKLPYYYPISPFQRTSSYVHPPTAPTKIERLKPCQAKQIKDMQTAAQNLIKPSYLLPYPFTYVNQYNYTDYPGYSSNIYYNNQYPWNYYNQQQRYQPYYNAYIAQVPKAQIPNAVLMNPHLHEDVIANVEQKPVENKDLLSQVLVKTKENIIPEWKTEQLSSQILDEVKANIDTSKIFKAFPFRKKLTLEKVGKLIKLDELTRLRRSIVEYEGYEELVREEIPIKEELKEEKAIHKTDPEESVSEYEIKEVTEDPTAEGEYETYLERTTCQTRPVPGFFRYGNLTQPYPECCPQLIKNR